MKAKHQEILDLIEEYLSQDGTEHLRFTQALYNLGINSFDDSIKGFYFRDNHNDSDEKVLNSIKKVMEE